MGFKMSSRLDTVRLLTPPEEKAEIHPYRRVWRSMILESSILGGVTVGVFTLVNLLHVQLPSTLQTYTRLGLALLPCILWLIFSWWAERQVPQPRERLVAVAIISALVANAVGVPLINNFLQTDRWLPLSNAITRIIGYTFTVGIVQEMLKYLVVRYVAWPNQFRIHLDGLAYGAASAIGYATVLNLHFALSEPSAPDIAALRIFATYVLHIVTSNIVGYGLSEVRFSTPTPLFLPMIVALAAFITGVSIPIRAGLINASLSLAISAPRAIFGLGFSIALLIAPSLILAFLLNNIERRVQETLPEEGRQK